jgi:cytidine deaminase
MNKKSLNIEFVEYESIKGLNSELLELVLQADNNLNNAYAPYSNFKVSAVCKLENGESIIGTNQENAAYPSGICAERVAVFAAKSKYPNQKIKKIVITTEKSNELPFTPCGACRQVISEYELQQKSAIQIVLKSGNSKIWVFNSISDLLPFSFNGGTLLKKG